MDRRRQKNPVLVMTFLVRDEEDIIRENIEYHLHQGVDFFIAIDNASTDGTTKILKEYERKGILKYYYEPSDVWMQSEWATGIVREACLEHGADWVISNDADEFWIPVCDGQTLKEALESLGRDINVVEAKRSNFVPLCDNGKVAFFQKMIYRERDSKNPIGKPLPPKVIHRASASICVSLGNHSVSGLGVEVKKEGIIEVLHFPMRSIRQYEAKMINLGRGHENAGRPNLRRRFYRQYMKNNTFFVDKYEKECYSSHRLIKAWHSGALIRDTRVRDILYSIL